MNIRKLMKFEFKEYIGCYIYKIRTLPLDDFLITQELLWNNSSTSMNGVIKSGVGQMG